LVLWPKTDGQLSRFMQWLTMTHAARWHAHRHSVGRGHLYQGRFRSFPIQQDHHFLGVCRYVERNALRANLVAKAQDWRWSSLWARDDRSSALAPFLAPGRWIGPGGGWHW
jgi:putative transposase